MEERLPTSCPTNGASDHPNSVDNNSEEWCVPIFHEICLLDQIYPTKHNLCDLIDQSNKFNKFQYRFSSTTYNISEDGSRKKLQDSLIAAAKQSGGLDLIVASGRMKTEEKTGAKREFVLQCACSKPYVYRPPRQLSNENAIVSNPNEESSAEQQQQQQGGGRKRALYRRRRTRTKRVVDKGEGACKFRLPVYTDNIGFFVRGRIGYNRHSAHPKPGFETRSTGYVPEMDKSRVRIATKRIKLNAATVEEEETFQGESGGSYDETNGHDIRETISSDNSDDDGANDFSDDDDVDQAGAIDLSGTNDDSGAVVQQLDPYEELNPIFQQIMDMIQANRTNELVLKAKSMSLTMAAELEKYIIVEGDRALNSSLGQQATNSSSSSPSKHRHLVP